MQALNKIWNSKALNILIAIANATICFLPSKYRIPARIITDVVDQESKK